MGLRKRDLRLGRIKINNAKDSTGECSLAWPNRIDHLRERKSQGAFPQPIKWKWKNIEESKGASDGSFAISERIPREADPGIEIMERRIRYPIVLAWHRRALVKAGSRSEGTMDFSREGHEFIAKTQIQSEIGAQPPVVLDVASDDIFTNACFCSRL